MSGGDTDDWESTPTSHCICYDLSCSPTAPSPFPGGPAPQQSVSQSVSDQLCQPAIQTGLSTSSSLSCSAPSTLRIFNYDSVCEPFQQQPSHLHSTTYWQTSALFPPPPDALHCLETTSWHRSTCPLTVPPSRVATRGSSTASYPSQTLQPTPNGPCSQYKLPCSTPSKVAGPRRASSRSKPKEVSFIPSPLPRRAARRHPADDLPRT